MIQQTKKILSAPLILWMIVTMACVQPLAGLLGSPDGLADEAGRDPGVIAQATVELRADVRSTLGNLEADQATVEIPQHTFDRDTTLTMAYLGEPPGDGADQFTPLGPTVALKVEGEQTRFNEPVRISLKFDPGMVNGPGDVYAAYYDEAYGWHYFVPDEVDMERGVMHFTTYHFSFWGAAQPTDEEIIDQFVTKQSTEQFVRQTQQELANQQVEAMVRQIMEEGMGVYDNRTIGIITRAVLKEAPFGIGKIGIAIYDNKPDEAMSVTLEETAKALGKALRDGTVAAIAGEAGTVGAFASAAGAYAEGDYEGALRIMANEIASNTPLVKEVKKAIETTVEVVDHWIQDQWKRPGLDKAFEVYFTGQNKYGYRNVRPGDFDEVLSQMGPSLERQVRIDYVRSYCAQRGCDPSQLSAGETVAIGDRGIELLRQQWEARFERREEIERIKANNMALIELFRDKGLLEMVPGRNPMYTGHEDMEMMLNRLNQMTQRILRDTGRTSFVTHSYDLDPDNPDSQLWGQDIADLVWIWYVNRPDSEEAYQQALLDLGLIAEVEEEEEEEEIEPIKFSISGEFETEEPSNECSPPIVKVTFHFELWNVGADYGEEYGKVNVITLIINPTCVRENISNECDCRSGILDGIDAVFSGGPNGVITAYVGGEFIGKIGNFVNGEKFVLDMEGFSPLNEIVVPDPSVFDGLE